MEAFAGQIISFGIFLVLARLLTPADFGLIALANIYVLIVQYLIFQGLGQAIIQFEDLDDEYLNTVFWINLAISLFFAILTWLTAKAVAGWFASPGLAPILQALSPIFLLAALSDVQTNLLGRHLQFKSLALRTLLSYALGGLVGIFLAGRGYGVWSFVGQQLVVWLVNFLALWTASDWRPRLVFSTAKAKRLLNFGVNLMGVDLLNLSSKRVDQFVVGRSLGAQSLGFYAVGARVSSLVSEVIVKSLSRVTLSGLSRLQNEPERLQRALYRVFELQMAVALPVAVGMALLAGPIVQLCFGAKWMAGIPVMQVLLLAIPFEALSSLHFSALISLGRPRWCSILMAGHAFLNIIFCVSAARYGVVAIALAVAARAFVLYPIEVWAVKRVTTFSAGKVFKLIAPIILATLLMSAATQATGRFFSGSGIGLLTCQIVAGAIAYLGFLVMAKPGLFQELTHLKQMLGNKSNPL